MAETGIREERAAWLSPALLIAGVVALGYALLRGWNAQQMNPGVEGAITVGVFAPMLLLLHGLRFSEMLKGAIPIWVVQFVACAAVSGPAIAGLGIELCVTGALGLLIRALTARSPARVTPAARRPVASERAPSVALLRAPRF
jgi:hypothetical protein